MTYCGTRFGLVNAGVQQRGCNLLLFFFLVLKILDVSSVMDLIDLSALACSSAFGQDSGTGSPIAIRCQTGSQQKDIETVGSEERPEKLRR